MFQKLYKALEIRHNLCLPERKRACCC